ncbi:MAG TPA: LptA/OstA family protein [Rectinema sp.]|nr:LptA/OstA family protein [Rectinema sp.]
MKSKIFALILSFMMIFVPFSIGFAQTNPPNVQPSPEPPMQGQQTQSSSGKKPIVFSANTVQGVIAKGKENTILMGSVHVTTGSLTITADRIDLSGEDYVNVVCLGNVTVLDTEKGFSLVAEKLNYHRDTEIGIAQRKVYVNDTKNNTIIEAEWLRFDQKQSIFEAAVTVQVRKEDMSISSEYALYNRDTEEIWLHGGAIAVTEDGVLKGDVISSSSDWSKLKISGEVSGTITPKETATSQ